MSSKQEEASEAIRDEQLVLGAIYGDSDFTAGTTGRGWARGTTFAIKLCGACILNFACNSSYPETEPPRLSLKVLPSSHVLLTEKHVAELESKLNVMARDMVGAPMCHELASFAETFIKDLQQKKDSHSVDLYKSMVERQRREEEVLRAARAPYDPLAPNEVTLTSEGPPLSWADVARVSSASDKPAPPVPLVHQTPTLLLSGGVPGPTAPTLQNPGWGWIAPFLVGGGGGVGDDDDDEEEEEGVGGEGGEGGKGGEGGEGEEEGEEGEGGEGVRANVM